MIVILNLLGQIVGCAQDNHGYLHFFMLMMWCYSRGHLRDMEEEICFAHLAG